MAEGEKGCHAKRILPGRRKGVKRAPRLDFAGGGFRTAWFRTILAPQRPPVDPLRPKIRGRAPEHRNLSGTARVS